MRRPGDGAPIGVGGDESAEVGVFPPQDGLEVDGWEGAVDEDGLVAVHLADDVGGEQVLALGVLRDGLAAAGDVGAPSALGHVFGTGDA